jgi:predicted  nucleic acid-binding Zn-ribbon protein
MLHMQDLNGLRAIEKDLRNAMSKTKDAAEKKKLQRRIGLIESKKSDLKNSK